MTNHKGVNGFEHRKQDIYRPTVAEARERGAKGGTVSGNRRHSGAKWRAVEAAIAASKDGVPSWSTLADLYDLAYDAGYKALWMRRRRAQKASEAA